MKITNLLPTFFVSALILGALVPAPAAALSCLSPAEHIPMLIEEERTIFTGEIVAARETNGNVTEIDVAVTEVLQGEAAATTTVEYEYDDTWGYLCAGAPGEVGTVETFIIRDGDDSPYVVYSFATDSELQTVLEAELAGTATTTPSEPVEGESDRNLMFQIIELLEELLSLLQLR